MKYSVFPVVLLWLVPRHLRFLWQAFMTCCVNMATPIHFIDSKCHSQSKLTSYTINTITATQFILSLSIANISTCDLPDMYCMPSGFGHTYQANHSCPCCNYCIAQNGGRENFGEFGESRASCQSFTHPNLYHKTAGS